MNSDAELYFKKGNSKTSLRDYKAAIKFYDKAIELRSDFQLAYKNRGFAKKLAGDIKGSEADFKKSEELSK
ncbi:MAG: tetratricopeptide repeat protein [Ignavibacteriae bacterium]|nr:tetratricopeptide repeat protein [Ignavibacteriota bacterium]